MLKIFQNTSFILLLVIVFALLAGDYVPQAIIAFFYALSLTIKEILVFVLPIVIFTYLASCILSLKQGAGRFLLVLVGLVLVSNFASIMTAYLAQAFDLIHVTTRTAEAEVATFGALTPAWSFSLPTLLSNDGALFLGLVTGLVFFYKRSVWVDRQMHILREAVNFFMNRLFIPILPLFILGFVLKLKYEGLLTQILTEYGPIFGIIAMLQLLYLGIFYILAAGFNLKQAGHYIRHVLPATLAGFTTMSSAAAMPLSIRAAEKNTGDSDLARAVIPATMNIHMIGDSIAISIMVMVILSTFGHDALTFYGFFVFALYFMVAKFTIAAVPGGSIIMMVPILESKLGFNGEMSALATALYILFDPLITAANVNGNGALAVLFGKIMSLSGMKKQRKNI